MGGSHSKDKKSGKYQQNPKPGKKGKRKPQKKATVKTDAKWSKATGGQVSVQHGGERKDSDVEDLKNPPQRERSKSLRFCDFTQLERTPRVGNADLLPIDIAFFQEGRVEPEELCHVCSVYTGSETLTCGVCYRAYHESCLSKIGQWSESPKPETGMLWTCHQCANLGNLLTEEEIINVLKRLDKCGIRREDDLTLADYMAYCHLSLQEDEGKALTRDKAENARRRFAQVDATHTGRITWCQFLNIESVRILNKRSKNSLVRLLTSPELERARDAFRTLDTDMDGRITKATAHEALDRNSRRSGYYPDETMMYIDDDLSESVSWLEFLRDRAIYIIAERPWLRASPSEQTLMRKGSARSSSTASPMSAHILAHFQSKGGNRVSGDLGPRSVPTTPVSKLPPDIHLSSLRHLDGSDFALGTKSVPTTPLSKNSPAAGGQSSTRPSGQAQPGIKSLPSTPPLKSPQGFPLLPPPPSSGRASSYHPHHVTARSASSVPTTPTKQPLPDFLCQGITCSAQLSEAAMAGHRASAGSESSASSRNSASGENAAILKGRRSSGQNEAAGQRDGATSGSRRSSQSDASGLGHPGHVAGKPPIAGGGGIAGDGRHSRAVAGPAYGKLVERLQSGDWRQKQARSVMMTSDSPAAAQLAPPTLGYVSADLHTLTGRRPLSLV